MTSVIQVWNERFQSFVDWLKEHNCVPSSIRSGDGTLVFEHPENPDYTLHITGSDGSQDCEEIGISIRLTGDQYLKALLEDSVKEGKFMQTYTRVQLVLPTYGYVDGLACPDEKNMEGGGVVLMLQLFEDDWVLDQPEAVLDFMVRLWITQIF